MLIGVGELISERIAGLDRILSGKRLYRGFGELTAGGLLGIPMAVAGFRRNKKRAAAMLVGSVLCTAFAGLLFAGYKKQRIPRHKYADREMFSAGFSFLRWSSESYPDRGGYKQREEQRYLLFPHRSDAMFLPQLFQ